MFAHARRIRRKPLLVEGDDAFGFAQARARRDQLVVRLVERRVELDRTLVQRRRMPQLVAAM